MMRRSGISKILVLAMASAVLAGCASWRFEGSHDAEARIASHPARTGYAIERLDLKIGNNEYYSLATKGAPLEAYEISRCRPDVFDMKPDASSNLIKVTIRDEREVYSGMWSLLVPYTASLCILPTWFDCDDVYSVKVELPEKGATRTAKFKMSMHSHSAYTFYSPIGLFCCGEPSPGAVSHRMDTDMFTIQQTLCDKARHQRREVFCETLAAGLVECLKAMEGGLK